MWPSASAHDYRLQNQPGATEAALGLFCTQAPTELFNSKTHPLCPSHYCSGSDVLCYTMGPWCPRLGGYQEVSLPTLCVE